MVLAASLPMCLHHPLPSLPAAFHGSSSMVKWVKNSQESQTLLLCTSLAPRNEINMSANRCYFRERGKRFQFTIISSNKNKKIGSSLPNCLGKSLASISKVGPLAHHNPTIKWLLWGNIGPYRKSTNTVCYLHCCERINSFPGFYLYFRHIFYATPYNSYFCKASNKNFKSLSDNQTYNWCYRKICWKC